MEKVVNNKKEEWFSLMELPGLALARVFEYVVSGKRRVKRHDMIFVCKEFRSVMDRYCVGFGNISLLFDKLKLFIDNFLPNFRERYKRKQIGGEGFEYVLPELFIRVTELKKFIGLLETNSVASQIRIKRIYSPVKGINEGNIERWNTLLAYCPALESLRVETIEGEVAINLPSTAKEIELEPVNFKEFKTFVDEFSPKLQKKFPEIKPRLPIIIRQSGYIKLLVQKLKEIGDVVSIVSLDGGTSRVIVGDWEPYYIPGNLRTLLELCPRLETLSLFGVESGEALDLSNHGCLRRIVVLGELKRKIIVPYSCQSIEVGSIKENGGLDASALGPGGEIKVGSIGGEFIINQDLALLECRSVDWIENKTLKITSVLGLKSFVDHNRDFLAAIYTIDASEIDIYENDEGMVKILNDLIARCSNLKVFKRKSKLKMPVSVKVLFC